MTEEKPIWFVCPFCNRRQAERVDNEMHQRSIASQPNGLVTYSNIHSCNNGILNLLDLRVDTDLNVRSIEKYKLVNDSKLQGGTLPIPSIAKSSVSRSLDDFDFFNYHKKIRISSELYSFDVQFGRMVDDMTLHELTSPTGDIKVHYTGERDEKFEVWFQHLADILELSPPYELGILLEAFQYIFDCYPDEPTDFDIEILKTIFVSQEVIVDPVTEFEEEFNRLLTHHNIDKELVSKIHSASAVHGSQSILELTSITKSLVMTVYYSMLLEKHNLTTIQRPGILSKPFYLETTETA